LHPPGRRQTNCARRSPSSSTRQIGATIEEEHNLEQYTRDRERKLLKLVAQAIARMDSGDYGWCEGTGAPIGIGRLLASPTANLTVEAQERREARARMFGTSVVIRKLGRPSLAARHRATRFMMIATKSIDYSLITN